LAIERVTSRTKLLQSGGGSPLLREDRPPAAMWGHFEPVKAGDP